MNPHRVLLLPGAVLPAELAYADLIDALGARASAVAKDLELYAGEEPPEAYSLDHEVAGIVRAAGDRGWEAFHLVGYSAGGAAALALVAQQPERVLSLALLEPAWAGRRDLSERESAHWKEVRRLHDLPAEEFMRDFVRLNLGDGVRPPPPPEGEPPPWMAIRPRGLDTLIRSFETYELEPSALRRFARPVYFALGGLSNADQYGEIARRLERIFPDFRLEVFAERHHFDPPHRIEPERLAESLTALWERADPGEVA